MAAVFPHTPMPERGLPRSEVMQQLISMKQDDQDWRGGRVFSLVYSAGDDLHELLSDALSLYSAENGLNVLAFPSIGIMQHDIVSNTASLLGADEPAAGGEVEGYLTSGGTESLLQAVKTARDVGRERGIARPRVVAGESAHAAFTKAADYFDVELVRVPVETDYTTSAAALDAACTDDTIMVVGSAPTYPQGVVDPIADIAALAERRGILCHVDACMGGFLLPFLSELERFDQPFDFRVPGVTSMSADVHKYGYASKGVSVVLYRSHELARKQLFVTTDWLGGFYASTAMAGTRPAGPVAAAWAAMMHLGRTGYLELTRVAHDAATRAPGRHRVGQRSRSAGRPPGNRHGLRCGRTGRARHLRGRRATERRGVVPGPPEPSRLAARHRPRRQRGHRGSLGRRPAAGRQGRRRVPHAATRHHLRPQRLTSSKVTLMDDSARSMV